MNRLTQRDAVLPTSDGGLIPVADDVACLQLSIVNVYFVGPPDAGDRNWVLVDTGLSISGGRIRREAEQRFGPGSRPGAIILTHGHFDHIGSVRELAERWECPVFAHRLELPYLTGRSDYPPPDPAVGGGLMAYLSRLYSRSGIDLGRWVGELPPDGTVPGMPRWRWVHTPGHAPGHVSLFRDTDRVLIAGDAFVTTKQESLLAVLAQVPRVHRPPAYFTIDWGQAGESVRRLAALSPSVAATGHGVPMRGPEVRAQLEALARHFDRAVPSTGRYVRRPATADETGVTSVPPPVFDPVPWVLGAAGVVAVGVYLGSRRSSS